VSVSVRRVVAVAGVAALTLSASSTAAFAASHSGHAKHPVKHHVKHSKKHVKKATKFTATGTLDAADASTSTFTMDDIGGSKDLHGKLGVQVVVTAKTKITLDDAPATLSQLVAGDPVAVNGVRGASGELIALHVNASQVETPEPTVTDPAPEPTVTDPAPEPTATASIG